MTRVVLTGASGFIGRPTLAALCAAQPNVDEVHVVALDAGESSERVTWHQLDLLANPGVVGELGCDVLVHLAWYARPGVYWTAMENLEWVAGSLAVLRAFAASGGRRVLIAGTCAEYEWTRDVYAEDAACHPATLYGAAKHGLHEIASALARQVGLSLAWGRLFFLHGPGEPRERFVPSLACSLLEGERAPMTAGTQVRDFMHVDDAGAALAALALSDVQGAVNVASGEGVALRDLAALIARETGGEGLLDIGALALRAGDPPSLVADVTRLREEVGWRPRLTVGEGIGQTVQWWRARLSTLGPEGVRSP